MPHVSLALDWLGDLKFRNSAGSPAIDFDSSAPGVTSPPQALAYAVMGCIGMDIVHVIRKGRYELTGLSIAFEGERAEEHPRRYLSMQIRFVVDGDVPDHVVERAIDLSRTKYCTVWNTIRPDVRLDTTFEVRRP